MNFFGQNSFDKIFTRIFSELKFFGWCRRLQLSLQSFHFEHFRLKSCSYLNWSLTLKTKSCFAYFLTCLLAYLIICLLTYLLTNLPTYFLTYLFQNTIERLIERFASYKLASLLAYLLAYLLALLFSFLGCSSTCLLVYFP